MDNLNEIYGLCAYFKVNREISCYFIARGMKNANFCNKPHDKVSVMF